MVRRYLQNFLVFIKYHSNLGDHQNSNFKNLDFKILVNIRTRIGTRTRAFRSNSKVIHTTSPHCPECFKETRSNSNCSVANTNGQWIMDVLSQTQRFHCFIRENKKLTWHIGYLDERDARNKMRYFLILMDRTVDKV